MSGAKRCHFEISRQTLPVDNPRQKFAPTGAVFCCSMYKSIAEACKPERDLEFIGQFDCESEEFVTWIIETMRGLREKSTKCEKIMADYLTKQGIPFVPQAPFRLKETDLSKSRVVFIDFYLPAHFVCIEIDGDSHNGDDSREKDERRDTMLARLGLKVIRIPNDQVLRGYFGRVPYLKFKLAPPADEQRCGRVSSLLSLPYSEITTESIPQPTIHSYTPKLPYFSAERMELRRFQEKNGQDYYVRIYSGVVRDKYMAFTCYIYSISDSRKNDFVRETFVISHDVLSPGIAFMSGFCYAIKKLPNKTNVGFIIDNLPPHTRKQIFDNRTETEESEPTFMRLKNAAQKNIAKKEINLTMLSVANTKYVQYDNDCKISSLRASVAKGKELDSQSIESLGLFD